MPLSILNDSLREVTEQNFARLTAENFTPASDVSLTGRTALLIKDEVEQIRQRLFEVHSTKIRFIIWVGAGSPMEDIVACAGMGLLRGGPLAYTLDSTDPEKLKAIVDDMQQRAQEPIARLLPSTLVIGTKPDSAADEPSINLEKLTGLYDKFRIDRTANFFTLAPADLYALAFAGRDLNEWLTGSVLDEAEQAEALKLAAFLQAQSAAGRNKVTLLLPKSWLPLSLRSKQEFEGNLAGSQGVLKIVIGEKFNGKIYRRVSDSKQDRVFLVVQRRGEAHPDGAGITSLRAAKYPMSVITFPAKGTASHYMAFMHRVVPGLGRLRKAVDSDKRQSAGATHAIEPANIEQSKEWQALTKQSKRWLGVVGPETPETLANAIRYSADGGKVNYGELTFFGDMRYSEEGKPMRRVMEDAAQRIFRVKLKMIADVGEGPAVNHLYREMSLNHGGCFSILLVSEKQTRFPTAAYEPLHHMAQFLAAKQALEQKGRIVRAILVKDLSPDSIKILDQFFSETAAALELH